MNYIEIGHKSRPQDTELWWWTKDNPTHLNRASPLGTWTHKQKGNPQEYVTHNDVREDEKLWDLRYFRGEYAQGRVDHSRMIVSLIVAPGLGFKARVIEHLLKRHFPGYDIHQYD